MRVFKEFSLKWILAVVVHLILLQCALELRRCPEGSVLEGLRGNRTDNESGPAKRVVLTIVGGLRWDLYYEESGKSKLFKYFTTSSGTTGTLYSFAEDHLSGLKIMMTGVPGVDVKTEVDSVFSHSKGVFIGPPSANFLFPNDWVKLFYKSEWENRTKYPYPRLLNEWVIDKAGGLLTKRNGSLTGDIEDNELMIIYLPGIEISDHLFGPNSSYTSDELIYLMDSVNSLCHKIEKHFDDSSTAFILTSSNSFAFSQHNRIMNHSEMAVPFVTWGAGFCTSMEFAKEKDGSYRRRSQMGIQDIAPLISSLLGIPIPFNSFGVSPLYCLKSNELRAEVSLSNARQIVNLYQEFESRLSYGWAHHFSRLKTPIVLKYITNTEELISANECSKSIDNSQELIQLCLGGIDYYRGFTFRNISACVLLSLLAWISVTLGWVMKKVKITPLIQRELLPRPEQQRVTEHKPKQTFLKSLLTPRFIVHVIGAVLFLGTLWALIYMSVPFSVLSSTLFTAFMLWLVLKEMFLWCELYSSNTNGPYQGSAGKPLIHFLFFIIFTLIIENPVVLSGAFVIGITFSCLTDLRRKQKPYPTFWTLSSLPLLVLLHHETGEVHFPTLLFGGILWIIVYGLSIYSIKPSCFDLLLLLTWSLPMVAVIFIILYGITPSSAILVLSWTPVFLLFAIPFLGSSRLPVRLLQICSCLCIHVTLLSMNFELTALFISLVHIFCWLLIEGFSDFGEFLSYNLKYESCNGTIVWSDVRCCIYYFAYVIISFLAIGNSLDVQSWLNSWPNFVYPSSMEYAFFRVFLRTFPVILLFNIAVIVIGRNNLSGYLVTKLFLSALVSFFQFLLITDYSTTICIQFIFLLSYLSEPISIILLGPSLFSKLNKAKVGMAVSVNI